MKQISLTHGQTALVSDEDHERLSQWKWYCQDSGNGFYAARSIHGIERRVEYMHREVAKHMGLETRCVDHINGNSLDNRRENLRDATRSQNVQNRRVNKNKAGFKGVYFRNAKSSRPWYSALKVNGQRVHLGSYATPEEAYAAYCEGARQHFGEYARFQ